MQLSCEDKTREGEELHRRLENLLRATQTELLHEPIVGRIVERIDREIHAIRNPPPLEKKQKTHADSIDLLPSDDRNNQADDDATFVGNYASVRDWDLPPLQLRGFTATLVGSRIFVIGGVRRIDRCWA